MDKIKAHYGRVVNDLSRALGANDEGAFFASLDELVRTREGYVIDKLGDLTLQLQAALERFRLDSRIVDLAEKEVPDAREGLARVLKMTDAAAHRTMDLIEEACPPAERIGQLAAKLEPLWTSARESGAIADRGVEELVDGFLGGVRRDAELVQRNLKQVLITQEYQDLSGQIIRSVMVLIAELEGALRVLAVLTREGLGGQAGAAPRAAPAGLPTAALADAKVSGQGEIDSLLSSFNL
jgi:chemotaxis protein CheZ